MKLIIFLLIPLILSIGIIPVIPLDVHADYIENYSLPYVLDPLTDLQIKECESIHKDFASLSDSDFYNRYLNNNISGNCVMLFEDELWGDDGLDRYEKLSERSAELVQEHETELKQSRENFYVESKSVIELEIPGTFLFIFEGCTGDQTIDVNDISVVSDKETVSLTQFADAKREILPGTCNQLEIRIHADDPSSIKVVISSLDIEVPAKIDESIIDIEVDESQIIYKSPKSQMDSGIAVEDIICKSDLTLMIRASGGAACVTQVSAEKLVIRGFGTIV